MGSVSSRRTSLGWGKPDQTGPTDGGLSERLDPLVSMRSGLAQRWPYDPKYQITKAEADLGGTYGTRRQMRGDAHAKDQTQGRDRGKS
jgi:hypothetical protein